MKRALLCIATVFLVATFPVPGGADLLPGQYIANVISNDSPFFGSCGKVLFNEPTFVGGVKTNEGLLAISFDFGDAITPPVTNPATPTGNCSPYGPPAGSSFDLCRLIRFAGNSAFVFIKTLTDLNSNGQIDGAEGMITGPALNAAFPTGPGIPPVLTSLVVFDSYDGSCTGNLLYGTGFYIRSH